MVVRVDAPYSMVVFVDVPNSIAVCVDVPNPMVVCVDVVYVVHTVQGDGLLLFTGKVLIKNFKYL